MLSTIPAPLFKEAALSPPPEPTLDEFDPDLPTEDAPYGWTRDPASGEWRPKKTQGRRKTAPADGPAAAPPAPGRTPSLEELKAAGPQPRGEDVPPAHGHTHPKTDFFRKPERPAKLRTEPAPAPIVPFRAGPIAKGMNKLYRKAGKILRFWDPVLGQAVIECTYKDEDDQDASTVGEAWEELARVNPRIRGALLKLVSGGAVAGLIAAHLPIILAICMKESVQRKLPILKLLGVLLDDEDTGPADPATMMGGLEGVDLAQMMAMTQGLMGQMGMDMPRNMNEGRPGAPADFTVSTVPAGTFTTIPTQEAV